MRNKKSFQNEKYLEFIRKQQCIVSGKTTGVIAHHVRLNQNGGIGLKPSDYRAIPLTQELHQMLHNKGEKSFYREHDIADIDQYIALYLWQYLCIYKEESRLVISTLENMIEEIKK